MCATESMASSVCTHTNLGLSAHSEKSEGQVQTLMLEKIGLYVQLEN